MSRKTFIAGNWKCFKTLPEAKELAGEIAKGLWGYDDVEVAVFPPYTALAAVREVVRGTPIGLGAQNVHWEKQGAHTGEVSTGLLVDVGCEFVILGHSERRQFFNETNVTVNHKLKKTLTTDMVPVVAVGENLEQRESGRMMEVIKRDLSQSLAGLTAPEAARVIIAYEPVWAIGTGRTATPETAQEVHNMIRSWLADEFGPDAAGTIRILYGGSVKPGNAADLMAQPDIDGALVGGASLEAESFVRIIRFREQV